MFSRSFYLTTQMNVLKRLEKKLKSTRGKKINILLYQPVYVSFPICYIYYKKYIFDKIKDIHYFNLSSTNVSLEVCLYYSLNIHKIKVSFLETLYYLDKSEYEKYYEKINKLRDIYQNDFENLKQISDFKFDNLTNSITIRKLIDKLNDNYNIIEYSFPNVNANNIFKHNKDQLFFSIIVLVVHILQKNGTFIVHISNHSKELLKQLIYLLSFYFKKIKYVNKSYFIESHITSSLLICSQFRGNLTTKDSQLLFDILEKWNRIDITGGINYNFKNKKSRQMYNITEPFNPEQHNNVFVTSVFDFNYPNEFNLFFDRLYNKLYKIKYIDKLSKIVKDTDQISSDDILEAHRKTFDNNLQYNIQLCESVGLIVKPELKLNAVSFKKQIEKQMFDIPKLYEYSINTNYDIHDPLKYDSSYHFEYTSLKQYKNMLNVMKFFIDSLDKDKWAKTTDKINIPKNISYYVKRKTNYPISRGFIKLYELLEYYNLIDLNNTQINTFHTCEMPGNFISATNYYIKSKNNKINYNWFANSLNPFHSENKTKYKGIFDDYYGYYKKYKSRWLFGEDNSGDITSIANIRSFEMNLQQKIDLFTSDCGLASTNAKEIFEQEKRLSKLNFCQVFISLLVLNLGGNAIFKLFIPLSESITVSILYLCSVYFEKMYLVKQASGSPGSSEIYCVCIGKRHLEQDMREYLYKCLEKWDDTKSLFRNIPDNFMNQIEKCSKFFVQKQIDYLYRSFYYYNNPDVLKSHNKLLDKAKHEYSRRWYEYVKFHVLDSEFRL
jgi:23S rRNA U2552 (ribose-2'-O)-methylase RlmE/FtsJ